VELLCPGGALPELYAAGDTVPRTPVRARDGVGALAALRVIRRFLRTVVLRKYTWCRSLLCWHGTFSLVTWALDSN